MDEQKGGAPAREQFGDHEVGCPSGKCEQARAKQPLSVVVELRHNTEWHTGGNCKGASAHDTPLKFLSVGAHSYLGGKTILEGRATVTGDPSDTLKSLELEVTLPRGKIVATLDDKARSLFENKSLAKALKTPATQRLFSFDSAASASKFDPTKEEVVSFRVKASSALEPTKYFPLATTAHTLILYTGASRYLERNDKEGGDGWVRPSVKPVIERFVSLVAGTRVGDITHMNGGKFDPHATHGEGTAYDGHFPGYNAMNAATCDAMLKLLFDEVYGDRIEKMFVLYKGHKAFEAQLAKRFGALEAEVKALAGKKAPLTADEKARLNRARALVGRRGLLINIPHHDTHYHITVRPK